MPFTITITETKLVTTEETGAFCVVDEVPWTEDTIEDKRKMFQSKEELLAANPLHKIYGYSPKRPITRTVETKVMEQTVEALDLAAVIKAVNGL